MHLSQHKLCTRKMELALDMKFDVDFHWVTRPWQRTPMEVTSNTFPSLLPVNPVAVEPFGNTRVSKEFPQVSHILLTRAVRAIPRSGDYQWRDAERPMKLLKRWCEHKRKSMSVFKGQGTNPDRIVIEDRVYTLEEFGRIWGISFGRHTTTSKMGGIAAALFYPKTLASFPRIPFPESI